MHVFHHLLATDNTAHINNGRNTIDWYSGLVEALDYMSTVLNHTLVIDKWRAEYIINNKAIYLYFLSFLNSFLNVIDLIRVLT